MIAKRLLKHVVIRVVHITYVVNVVFVKTSVMVFNVSDVQGI